MAIDLRSDTVTRPSAAMRAAMAAADVGDDVYGEDPTVRTLEERSAAILGHEAALFVTSGTMGNQLGIMLGCRRGDDVIVGEGAHCVLYESGALGGINGVQAAVAGKGGLFDAAQMEAAMHPRDAYYMPRTRLVAIENTHNRGGGAIWPQEQLRSVIARARELGLGLHLDGARIWNAAVASSASPASLAAPFDTVTACFSKGLGAPVGSVLAADRARIADARRFRKMLGGAMRQAGVLAAAAIYALDHNLSRLSEDHANAHRLGERLRASEAFRVDPVPTNIVNVETRAMEAARLVESARDHGVLVNATGPRRIRLVTHLDVDAKSVDAAAEILCRIAEA